jgi:hypothetical protein
LQSETNFKYNFEKKLEMEKFYSNNSLDEIEKKILNLTEELNYLKKENNSL